MLTLSAVPVEGSPKVAAVREEVATLRAALEEVQSEVAAMRALPPTAEPDQVEEPSQTPAPEGRAEPEQPPERQVDDGLLVRTARWLEPRLKPLHLKHLHSKHLCLKLLRAPAPVVARFFPCFTFRELVK